jgi:hypothetical protein
VSVVEKHPSPDGWYLLGSIEGREWHGRRILIGTQ